ncbi:oligosaccharide flippase family protein [Pantanalinema rosaneae CENA516]|uniref:oligosaccharide flippase family protein n=1 Tax=Pantanalinema rosaneae TaxID=1620701 RepID=UPI003D6EC527
MTSEQPVPLKNRAIRGSILTLLNNGGSQVLRLASSLILSRLLFPRDFGLMALVQSFMFGLEMFSDVGVVQSIIHNKRGDDPIFLNTAWTIQAIRGIGLWICAGLLAVPAAHFYGEPALAQILPVVGISAFLSGLNSTKMATMNRQIKLGKLTVMELGCQAITLISTVLLAFFLRSVWALVIGGIFSTFLRMLATHFYLEGDRNFFCWNKEAFQELRGFGQWIFLSSIMGYLAIQGDRLVLGRIFDVTFLGVYMVALTFSLMPTEVTRQVVTRVFFPSYAEIVRTRPERLYATLKKSRFVLLGLSWAASLFLFFFGSYMIRFLYPATFAGAAWMLPLLALGTLGISISASYDSIFLATGNSKVKAGLVGMEAATKLVAMIAGYYLGQKSGVNLGGQIGGVIGVASSSWLYYPFEAICLKRISMLQLEIDLPLIGIAALLAVGTYLTWSGV